MESFNYEKDTQTPRVFPLSNWTEVDVGAYIKKELNVDLCLLKKRLYKK